MLTCVSAQNRRLKYADVLRAGVAVSQRMAQQNPDWDTTLDYANQYTKIASQYHSQCHREAVKAIEDNNLDADEKMILSELAIEEYSRALCLERLAVYLAYPESGDVHAKYQARMLALQGQKVDLTFKHMEDLGYWDPNK